MPQIDIITNFSLIPIARRSICKNQVQVGISSREAKPKVRSYIKYDKFMFIATNIILVEYTRSDLFRMFQDQSYCHDLSLLANEDKNRETRRLFLDLIINIFSI